MNFMIAFLVVWTPILVFSCTNDDECNENFQCQDTICLQKCENHDECPSQFCYQNICKNCTQSDDCVEGYCCLGGTCSKNLNAGCPKNSFCSNSTNCDLNLTCAFGKCFSACSRENPCINEDESCCSSKGMYCTSSFNGKCGMNSFCKSNSDCSTFLICFQGTCQIQDELMCNDNNPCKDRALARDIGCCINETCIDVLSYKGCITSSLCGKNFPECANNLKCCPDISNKLISKCLKNCECDRNEDCDENFCCVNKLCMLSTIDSGCPRKSFCTGANDNTCNGTDLCCPNANSSDWNCKKKCICENNSMCKELGPNYCCLDGTCMTSIFPDFCPIGSQCQNYGDPTCQNNTVCCFDQLTNMSKCESSCLCKSNEDCHLTHKSMCCVDGECRFMPSNVTECGIGTWCIKQIESNTCSVGQCCLKDNATFHCQNFCESCYSKSDCLPGYCCNNNLCVNQATPNGCSDGDFCLSYKECSSGICCNGVCANSTSQCKCSSSIDCVNFVSLNNQIQHNTVLDQEYISSLNFCCFNNSCLLNENKLCPDSFLCESALECTSRACVFGICSPFFEEYYCNSTLDCLQIYGYSSEYYCCLNSICTQQTNLTCPIGSACTGGNECNSGFCCNSRCVENNICDCSAYSDGNEFCYNISTISSGNSTCFGGKCVYNSKLCDNDNTCIEDEICCLGLCTSGECMCNQDSDCKSSQSRCCVKNLCVKEISQGNCPTICNHNSECNKENEECCNMKGYCQIYKDKFCPISTRCSSVSECEPGACCENEVCSSICSCLSTEECYSKYYYRDNYYCDLKYKKCHLVTNQNNLQINGYLYENCSIVDDCFANQNLSKYYSTGFCCLNHKCILNVMGYCPEDYDFNDLRSSRCNPCTCPLKCCNKFGECAQNITECIINTQSLTTDQCNSIDKSSSIYCTKNTDCPDNSCCSLGYCIPGLCNKLACSCNSQCVLSSTRECAVFMADCNPVTDFPCLRNQDLRNCLNTNECNIDECCLYGACRNIEICNKIQCNQCECPQRCCRYGRCSTNVEVDCPYLLNVSNVPDCLNYSIICTTNDDCVDGCCIDSYDNTSKCYPKSICYYQPINYQEQNYFVIILEIIFCLIIVIITFFIFKILLFQRVPEIDFSGKVVEEIHQRRPTKDLVQLENDVVELKDILQKIEKKQQ